MQQLESFVTSDLIRQHAPRLLEPPNLALGRPDIHARLNVELVEAQPRDTRLRGLHADRLLKLRDSGQVRQRGRIVCQVPECDKGVRLAASVGQLQLPHGFVVLPRETKHHVLNQRAQVVRGKRQCKEVLRPLVHRPLAILHKDLVEVRGEHVQGQFS